MTTLSSDGKQALDEFIAQTIAAEKLPGLVYGVSNLDEEIYFHGGGPNVVGDPSSGQVGPDSIMWIASHTKLVVALAALKLVEQGKVTLDTPVCDYLPQFRNPIIVDRTDTQQTSFKPAERVVTLKHLLTFSSGLFYPTTSNGDIPTMPDAYCAEEVHNSEDPTSEFFRIIQGDFPALPLKFEAGTDFANGWNSDSVGFFVEKVSGQTLERFCKENIFYPLGMKTSFFLTPELKERAVNLAYRDTNDNLHPWDNQMELIEQDYTKVRAHFGGAGLYSSMRDFLKLLRHLLQIHSGRCLPNAILKAETVHQIFMPALPEKGVRSLSESVMSEGTSWSTALAISTKPGRRRKGVAWWGGWAGTDYIMDPTANIAAVFGVQIVPYPDPEVRKVCIALENALYEGLN